MKKLVKEILNLILPNRCLTCNAIINQDDLFCLEHFKKLEFISDPKCKICSHSFDFEQDSNQDLTCVNCLKTKPSFDSSVAVFSYNETIAKTIFNLKYYDATFLSKKLGKILADNLKNKIDNYDIITCVALHKKRLKKRKFNQSALLCKEILKHHKHLKFYPDLLVRTKYSEAQAHLTQQQRMKNLETSFIINSKFSHRIANKKILLIDDVMTTQSTAENCSKALKKANCGDIKVVVIAKTKLRH